MPKFDAAVPARTILLLASISLGIYFLFSIAYRTLQTLQLRQEEVRLQRDVQSLETRNLDLLAERDRLQSDGDIERIAREDLNLIKPGETAVIVLPSNEVKQREAQEQAAQQRQAAVQRPWWQRLLGR